MFRFTLIGAAALLGLGAVLLPIGLENERSVAADATGQVDDVPSAIALLGETWDIGGGEIGGEIGWRGLAVVPPADLQAQDDTPLPRPSQVPLSEEPQIEQIAAPAEPLRRPIPRPVLRAVPGTSDVAQAPVAPAENPEVRQTIASEGWGALPARWTVRRQGTGEVVAELPLGEALSLMERRARLN